MSVDDYLAGDQLPEEVVEQKQNPMLNPNYSSQPQPNMYNNNNNMNNPMGSNIKEFKYSK